MNSIEARYASRTLPSDQWFDAIRLNGVVEHQCPKCPQVASLDCSTEDGGCTVVCAGNPASQSYDALLVAPCDYAATMTPDEVFIAVLLSEEIGGTENEEPATNAA